MGISVVDFLRLPAFASDGRVHVVVEAPRHARVKFKFSPTLQVFELSRALMVGLSYPYDWGFVPSTCAEDGDPLDGLIMHEATTFPGILIPCRAIGVLEVQQTQKTKTVRNDRVIFVPDDGLKRPLVDDVQDLKAETRREFEAFFCAAVNNTGKKLKFLGWRSAKHALATVNRSAKKFAAQQHS
jgi:inorganic pyrophosphatase